MGCKQQLLCHSTMDSDMSSITSESTSGRSSYIDKILAELKQKKEINYKMARQKKKPEKKQVLMEKNNIIEDSESENSDPENSQDSEDQESFTHNDNIKVCSHVSFNKYI